MNNEDRSIVTTIIVFLVLLSMIISFISLKFGDMYEPKIIKHRVELTTEQKMILREALNRWEYRKHVDIKSILDRTDDHM